MPTANARVLPRKKISSKEAQVIQKFVNVSTTTTSFSTSKILFGINSIRELSPYLSITYKCNVKDHPCEVDSKEFRGPPLIGSELMVRPYLIDVCSDRRSCCLGFPSPEITLHPISSNAVNLSDKDNWSTVPVHEIDRETNLDIKLSVRRIADIL